MRLLGEDLTLYKDLSGTFGLVDRHCPHRRADLSYGFVEQCGLRCNYHGWLFNEQGRCMEQPYEDVAEPEARFKDKVRVKAYPVEVAGGTDVGLPGSATGAAGPQLGAVHLAERLRPDRVRRRAVQLVSVPGKLHRSPALRVDAHELERAAARISWGRIRRGT